MKRSDTLEQAEVEARFNKGDVVRIDADGRLIVIQDVLVSLVNQQIKYRVEHRQTNRRALIPQPFMDGSTKINEMEKRPYVWDRE
jgi:hypothetical protein